MADTYDPTTPVGQVRLLVNDTDVDSTAGAVFTDAEITAFLTLNGQSVKRAAASALLAIAGDEALTSKVITDHELKTDGATLAKELRAQADTLKAEATEDEGRSDDDVYFDIVDVNATCYPTWLI